MLSIYSLTVRVRYEVNPEMVDEIQAAGLFFTGRDDRGQRMEIAEQPRSEHPFYFGTQYVDLLRE